MESEEKRRAVPVGLFRLPSSVPPAPGQTHLARSRVRTDTFPLSGLCPARALLWGTRGLSLGRRDPGGRQEGEKRSVLKPSVA